MNHPLIEGNKRIGFATATLFLQLNDERLVATEVDAVLRTLALAAGEMTEAEFGAWLKGEFASGLMLLVAVSPRATLPVIHSRSVGRNASRAAKRLQSLDRCPFQGRSRDARLQLDRDK